MMRLWKVVIKMLEYSEAVFLPLGVEVRPFLDMGTESAYLAWVSKRKDVDALSVDHCR